MTPNEQLRRKVILSLCDFSGNWCEFYRQDNGNYTVITVDVKPLREEPKPNRQHIVCDVNDFMTGGLPEIHGVLAAPPCTDFSVSGAQYWKAKDADGRTEKSVALVRSCIRIIKEVQPQWWAMENPVGRFRKFFGDPSWSFDPCDFAGYGTEADRYTKKTLIWGTAKKPEVRRLDPIRVCEQGSWIQKLGGKSERTKELRSMTPLGFAKAFKEANA